MTNTAFDILRHQEKIGKTSSVKFYSEGTNTDLIQVITFMIDDIVYATHISNVTEVMKIPGITNIPGTKDWMLGISNFRGDLLPLLDLGNILLKKVSKLNKKSKVLVVNTNSKIGGIIIEKVLGIQKISQKEILESDLCILNLKEIVQNSEFDVMSTQQGYR